MKASQAETLVAYETQVRHLRTGKVALFVGCRFVGGEMWLDVEVDGERRTWAAGHCEVAS